MPSFSDLFRALALKLPGAIEGEHCGHADFRVGGRIFATLSAEDRGLGVVKLTAEQQASVSAEMPEVFAPVPGGRGRDGSTHIARNADEATLAGALAAAHRNILARHAARRARPAARRQPTIQR